MTRSSETIADMGVHDSNAHARSISARLQILDDKRCQCGSARGRTSATCAMPPWARRWACLPCGRATAHPQVDEMSRSERGTRVARSDPVMRKRKNIARGTEPAKNVGDVGAVPLPIRFETVTKIVTGPVPIMIVDDFIGEEDTLEKLA